MKKNEVKEGKVVRMGKSHSFKVPKGFKAVPSTILKSDGSVSKSSWVMLKPVVE